MMLFSLNLDFIFNYMCIYCTILYLYLTLPKGPCEILSSVGVCRPQLTFSSSSLKLLGQIGTKFYWNDPWIVPFQNYIGHTDEPSNMVAVAKNRKKVDEISKIFSSETTGPNWTKLHLNDLKVVNIGSYCLFTSKSSCLKLQPDFTEMVLGWMPFKNWIGWPCLPTKMAEFNYNPMEDILSASAWSIVTTFC